MKDPLGRLFPGLPRTVRVVLDWVLTIAGTGGIGESLAAIIQEEAFESLDAPVRVIGALDTPVPYSPPLEEFFLPSDAQIERAARLLISYSGLPGPQRLIGTRCGTRPT